MGKPASDSKARYYIGLATTLHDSAIAIVDGSGKVIFAEATERHLQVKRGYNHPADGMGHIRGVLSRYCDPDAELVAATTWSTRFVFSLWIGSLLGRYSFRSVRSHRTDYGPLLVRRFQLPVAAAYMYQLQKTAGVGVIFGSYEAFGHLNVRLCRFNHHLTHAAHACYSSPFTEAVCVVVDGMGEFGSIATFRYADKKLKSIRRHYGFASLGIFYGLVTELCGFSWIRGEEWKVMGLAPYGKPDETVYRLLDSIIEVVDGRPRLASYKKRKFTIDRLSSMRSDSSEDFQSAANLALAGQQVFSNHMEAILASVAQHTDSENLVLCGGCALNSAFNGTVLDNSKFRRLYVPAAPADDGNAIGAALLACMRDRDITADLEGYPYLGSPLSEKTLHRLIRSQGGLKVRHLPGTVERATAALLAEGKIVGWLQGRAEFGPRALGNRSILADPRDPKMKTRINEHLKFRESFRPFAPAVLHEHGPDYFANYQQSPYMERALRLRPEAVERFPAVIHVDGSARLQSVTSSSNKKFHHLLSEFHRLTAVPMLLNTSFNIMGKPIVHTLEDALGMVHTTDMDALVIGDLMLEKPT